MINNYSIEECTYGGRVEPRVGSGRVRIFVGNRGSGRVNVSPGRVGSKKSDPWTTLPQVKSDKQMLTSNEKLIACLNQKNYSQILKFLELMEENCSTHILNYFISNQRNVELCFLMFQLYNIPRLTLFYLLLRFVSVLMFYTLRYKYPGLSAAILN